MTEDILDTSTLKNLLDSSIQDLSSGDQSLNNTKTQLNLSSLHNLLSNLIQGQKLIFDTVNESNNRLNNLENNVTILDNNLKKIEKWTEINNRNSNNNKKRRASNISDNSEVSRSSSSLKSDKKVLPPIEKSSENQNEDIHITEQIQQEPLNLTSIQTSTSEIDNSRQLKSTSSSDLLKSMVASSTMNFADQYDIQKLNRRIDLISTKLEKITEVVPDNDQILEEHQTTSNERQPVQEAWSKLMLTKRIDANEESLEKFMQLLDKLASEMDSIKNQILKVGEEFNNSQKINMKILIQQNKYN
jgi:hypothetical protein